MKQWGMILWLWMFLPVSALAAEDAKPCELRVGWEPYAPYTFADEDGRATGADIDLIKAIAEEIGCKLEFAELPWARILREVENGTLDVSTSTSWTPERIEWALFSEPYRETDMAIYVRRGEASRFKLRSLADVPQQRFHLGIVVDYYYGTVFADLMKNPDYAAWIDGATDYPTNIRKLINERIDGYLAEDAAVMEAEIKKLDLAAQVERYSLRIPGEQLRFMFSRQTVAPEIVAKVDAAIARMRTDGRLQAILSQYHP